MPSLLAALLVTLAALAYKGQDRNWDLRNYHLYNPSALVDGRYGEDIAVAQMQSWHNPAIDLPFAAMVRAGWPGWIVSLWLALPAFLAILFALRTIDLCWPEQRSRWRTAIGAVVAATGASVLPSIGTTFNDAVTAAGALAALWWIVDSTGRRGVWATWLPAGLMVGVAAGFKLTGSIYCIGIGVAAIACGRLREMPARTLATLAGGIVGALASAGPWALVLWNEHGNPLFPYFNQIFESPDALALPYNDTTFIPHGIDALLVPFHLLLNSARFSESKLADPRVLLGLVALALLVRDAWRRHASGDTARLRVAFVAAFTLASFASWVALYGIYRYLFAVEIVCSLLAVVAAFRWWPARWPRWALLIPLAIVLAATHRPRWGRHDSFTTPMVDVRFPELPPGTMIVTSTTHPVAHAIPYLPKDVPAIALANRFMAPDRCTRLQARAEQRVRAHEGPLFLLKEVFNQDPDPVAERYRDYGLEKTGACLNVDDSLKPLELCPLEKARETAVICASAAGSP